MSWQIFKSLNFMDKVVAISMFIAAFSIVFYVLFFILFITVKLIQNY